MLSLIFECKPLFTEGCYDMKLRIERKLIIRDIVALKKGLRIKAGHFLRPRATRGISPDLRKGHYTRTGAGTMGRKVFDRFYTNLLTYDQGTVNDIFTDVEWVTKGWKTSPIGSGEGELG